MSDSENEEFESADEGDEQQNVKISPKLSNIKQEIKDTIEDADNSKDGWDVDDWDIQEEQENENESQIKDTSKEIHENILQKDSQNFTEKAFQVSSNLVQTKVEKTEKLEVEKKQDEPIKYQNQVSESSTVKEQSEGDGWDSWEWNEVQETKPAEKTPKETNATDIILKRKNSDESIKTPTTSSWMWKPWGGVAASLISTASTISSQVSQGFSTVIESSIGIPDPEELAKLNAAQQEKQETVSEKSYSNDQNRDETILPSFGSIVTGVTSIGNKVISGGLDTLEEIGKKTMNILQENDPLLLNKRKLLGLESEKPVLSQVLREAKEKSEEIEKKLKQVQNNSYKKQLHFETLFDHYYGLVHLEALEMLSKQSAIKLDSLLEPLTGNARTEMEETLNEVKELCDLGDLTENTNDENDGIYETDELKIKFTKAIEDLDIQISFDEILKCWKKNVEFLKMISSESSSSDQGLQIYENGLRCLAETCALAMLKMHKIAEMLLIKDHHSTANEADALVQLTNVFCYHLNGIANRFGSALSNLQQTEELKSMITNLFVEVDNSTSYVQSAFQLFIPILQIGAA